MGKKLRTVFILIILIFLGVNLYYQKGDKKAEIDVPKQNVTDNSEKHEKDALPQRPSEPKPAQPSEAKDEGTVKKNVSGKKVFLTFDDGPSRNNTPQILDILNKSKVKATFFVIGANAEKNNDILKSLDDSKMCILSHTYSHEKSIYKSEEAYFEDLNKCEITVEKILGRGLRNIVRMPGGSSTGSGKRSVIEQIKNSLKSREMMYVDWNVSSLDASQPVVDKDIILNGVKRYCENQNFAVILMHDSATKKTTVEALPDIIEYLKNNDYEFRDFNDLSHTEKDELIKRKIAYR